MSGQLREIEHLLDAGRYEEIKQVLRAESEADRDLREMLRAWGLGDADKTQALLMRLFLREFGAAPGAAE